MYVIDLLKYYSNSYVQQEIADFAKNRWIAIHCEVKTKDNRSVLVRYMNTKPITIRRTSDVIDIIKHFSYLRPRTIYASASVYRVLENKSHALDYWNNVAARTPTWDIDSTIDRWKETLKVARIIINALESEGVSESVYLVWSGNGVHVRVHENAFSQELYSKINPINIGYAVVQYIINKVQGAINKLSHNMNSVITPIKVENLMDPQRVFTAPLSIHRTLDVATIAFKPEELSDFDISWTNPEKPRSNKKWRKYVSGEGDALAEKAFAEIGGYILKRKAKRTVKFGKTTIINLIREAEKKLNENNDKK